MVDKSLVMKIMLIPRGGSVLWAKGRERHSNSPIYKPSSCELSKMWLCICFQQGARTWAINVRCERHYSLPSTCWCCWSTISHLLSLLRSVALLACSLDASPWRPVVVLYFFKVLNCKIKNGFFVFCLFFMSYLYEKCYKPITGQYYIASCVSRVLGYLRWTYKHMTYECALGIEPVCT